MRRYLRELDDHLADLTEAQLEAGHNPQDAAAQARARLGGDEELAAAMLARPGFKSWAARWPWLVFGLLPPLASLLCFIVVPAPLGLVADWQGEWMQHHIAAPHWFQLWANATALLANFALGPALAALLVWVAYRQRLDWKWALLAAAIIALVGFHMVTRFPVSGRGGQISLTALQIFRLTGHYPEPRWATLGQFFLTLAPAFWLMRPWFARPGEDR